MFLDVFECVSKCIFLYVYLYSVCVCVGVCVCVSVCLFMHACMSAFLRVRACGCVSVCVSLQVCVEAEVMNQQSNSSLCVACIGKVIHYSESNGLLYIRDPYSFKICYE